MNLRCCINYSSEIINYSEVMAFIYQTTTQLCPSQAVIFLTADGKEVCSDPRAQWVRLLQNLLA
uniref:C-C motif chemokine n=1 Tax=Salarias fasciatus TaxID=181472 RepID=A0A672H039_SALFA